MLTKTHKTRLQKICKVLFPKYKYVKIDTHRNEATLSNYKCFLWAWLMPKIVYSLDELVQYRIPLQLSDFLYGNTSFVSVIQENLVRCELSKQNKIDYFYEEISKVKYEDIYKDIKIDPSTVVISSAPETEDEMWDELIRYEQERVEIHSLTRLFRDLKRFDKEIVFYAFLALIVLYSILY
jgi:hypothetical protein